MADNIVETVSHIGTLVIKNPFIEQENKTCAIFKDVNEIDFGFMSPEGKAKILSGTSSINAQLTI